jgi:hypothetical protein
MNYALLPAVNVAVFAVCTAILSVEEKNDFA